MKINLKHHSADFRRRLRQLNHHEVTRITSKDDTYSVEEQLSKDELSKLHDNIRFTQTVMKEEAAKRWEQ